MTPRDAGGVGHFSGYMAIVRPVELRAKLMAAHSEEGVFVFIYCELLQNDLHMTRLNEVQQRLISRTSNKCGARNYENSVSCAWQERGLQGRDHRLKESDMRTWTDDGKNTRSKNKFYEMRSFLSFSNPCSLNAVFSIKMIFTFLGQTFRIVKDRCALLVGATCKTW